MSIEVEAIEMVATDLLFPEGPVAMDDGTVYLVELARGTLTRLSSTGHLARFPVGGGPNGLALGPDGALYICNNGGADYRSGHFLPVGAGKDYAGGYIQRFDPATEAVETLFTHCGEHRLSAPNDLVFDREGGFYFTDTGKRLARHRDHGGLYYATIDGTAIVQVAYPILTPNGVALSPDEKVLYVADMETARLWAFDIEEPGRIRKAPFPSPYGGRILCGLPGFQRFDSIAVDAAGNICAATLVTGAITIISPAGEVLEQRPVPDDFPTNICFAGADMQTAYVTLAKSGRLCRMPWRNAGLRLNFAR